MTIKAETLFCATSAAPEFPIFEIDNIPDFYSIEDPSDKNRHLVLIPFKSQGQLIGSAVLHDVYDPSLISKENQKILSLVSTITAGYLHNLRLKEDFENASVFDHITGKYKYSFFQAFLEQEIERADRYETSATLMAIDVTSPDNLFIEPNESFYKKSSDKIFSVLRSIDLLFMHPENNSFIIILSQTDNSTSLDVAARVIQKFTKSLDEKTGEISEDTPLKVSIGLSTYPLDATLEANLVDNVFTCLDKARAAEESKIVNYCDIY
jgi:diguanylate cyclase (GGDEF)-like protein